MKRLAEIVGTSEDEIKKLIDKIPTPKVKQVIELRFGLKDGMEQTLKDVSKEMKISMELVRELEAKGIRFLKNSIKKKKSFVKIIKSFLKKY